MQVLSYRIGGSLKQVRICHRLLGGKHLDGTFRERIKTVRRADVTIQRCRVELRQHEELFQSGIDAIADRNIDQTVLSTERYRGFRSILSQREKTLAGA